MKLNHLRPLLYVTDLDATVHFYENVLGFACVNRIESWAALALDDVQLMVSLPNEHLPFEKPSLTGTLYFNTSDVDGWWKKLKDKCEVLYPMEDFEYGMREFAIRDNNGYILQFGQEIS